MNKRPDETEQRQDDREGTVEASEKPAVGPPPGPPPGPPSSPPPHRTLGWGVIVAVLLAFVLALGLGIAFGDRLSAGVERAWHAAGFGEHELVEKTADDGRTYWTCGMHPWVILPEPGQCPICHMDLVPLDPDKFTGELAIDPTVVQNIGVRIEPVVLGPLVRSVRTVGNVTFDETLVRNVNTKFSGWIEDLRVDSVGEPVKEGEVLFEVYSPELYSAQEEYLLALRSTQEAAPGVAEANQQLLQSARTRLKFFDLSDEQIVELEERGEPARTIAVESPYSGVVVEKMAVEGMRIDPGMRVYGIADLSRVWVQATVYEYQFPYVREGEAAKMTLPYLPGETFEGEVVYIYPYLNETTREATVRLEFDNPGGRLKPGMFANVMLQNTLGEEEILAPQAAVIETGKRQVAFVSLGEGRFEPRDVETGVETEEGMVQVLEGLEPGEQVVTSGQFLIDSESRMREALAKMIKGNQAAEQEAVVQEAADPGEMAVLPEPAAAALSELLEACFTIADQLAADSVENVDAPAGQVAAAAARLLEAPMGGSADLDSRQEQIETLRREALTLADASDLAQARLAFAGLSTAVLELTEVTGVPAGLEQSVQRLHCPMYEGGTWWLQPAGEVRNPYMGSAMLTCHDERDALPVTPVGEVGVEEAATQPADAAGLVEFTAAEQAHLDAMTQAYLALQQMLYEGHYEEAPERLVKLAGAAEALARTQDARLRSSAETVVTETAEFKAADLPSLRAKFKSLSAAVAQLLEVAPPSPEIGTLYRAYCPMAKASWLQAGKPIENPYYGEAHDMADCGDIEQTIAPGARE